MHQTKYRVKVPGKLMIAGEYAVLEPNQQAIVVAVDRYITATIERSTENHLSLPQLGLDHVSWKSDGVDLKFDVSDQRLRFIKNAITVVNQLLKEKSIEPYPFQLTITSELDDPSGRKYGLGSSAAIVVAVVTAILHLYPSEKIQPSPEVVFKLSAIAHFKTQGNGSCADIAASTFGGWICYSAFQPEWLVEQLHQGNKLAKLIEEPWPMLMISHLTPPLLQLCVGWSGEVAATAPMVTNIQKLRERNPSAYKQFLEESSIAVANMAKSFASGNLLGAISSLKQNRKALIRISGHAGVTIETHELKQLADIAERYGSGKSSGAGGGDCGIAFVNGNELVEKLFKAWEDANIMPLSLSVSQIGAVANSIQ